MKPTKLITTLLTAALIGCQLFSCGKKDDDYMNYSKYLDENGHIKGVKASEIVTLPQYKGIEIDPAVFEADPDAVQEQIDGILDGMASYEKITDRAVEDGDTVNIDYVGSVGGVEFEGGSTGGAGTEVTIGVTNYIDDFLEQLIGHKPGETFDVNVTFPDNYGKAELNGKDAVFVTTINHIVGDPLEPELTVDIAKAYGFETVDELVADVEKFVIENQKAEIFYGLLEQATCSEIPQAAMDYVIAYDTSVYKYYADMFGVSVDEYMERQVGYKTLKDYLEANKSNHEQMARYYLAAQAIAEAEGIAVTAADLEPAEDFASAIAEYGEPYVKQYILFQTLLPQFILDNGVVAD